MMVEGSDEFSIASHSCALTGGEGKRRPAAASAASTAAIGRLHILFATGVATAYDEPGAEWELELDGVTPQSGSVIGDRDALIAIPVEQQGNASNSGEGASGLIYLARERTKRRPQVTGRLL